MSYWQRFFKKIDKQETKDEEKNEITCLFLMGIYIDTNLVENNWSLKFDLFFFF